MLRHNKTDGAAIKKNLSATRRGACGIMISIAKNYKKN
jgi:hypothetical protein